MSGATKRDWDHLDIALGLGADLLPIAPADSIPSPNSKIKQFGKTPSAIDKEGFAFGFKDWPNRPVTEADIARWSDDRRLNLCVRTGGVTGVYAVDVDVTDPTLADKIAAKLPQWPRRERNNSSKFLLVLRLEGKHKKRIIDCGKHGRIEFLGTGQQFVACGDHQSGVPYAWVDGLPGEIPLIPIDELEEIWSDLGQFGVEPAKPARNTEIQGDTIKPLTSIDAVDLSRLRSQLNYKPLIDAALSNDVWSDTGYALLSLGAVGRELWLEFSEHHAALSEPGAAANWWAAHETQQPRSDYRVISIKVRALGWTDVEFEAIATPPGDTPRPSLIGEVPDAYHRCSDLANANRLRDANRGLLAVHNGAFRAWTGTHWTRDETIARRQGAKLSDLVHAEISAYEQKLKTLEARLTADMTEQYGELQELARPERTKLHKDFAADPTGAEILRVTAMIAALRKWAVECESEARINSALRLLKGMLNVPTEQFDRHPNLFNVLNGTIDLRAGTVKPHDPADFITQLAPVTYDAAADAPLFRKSVLEIMNGDQQDAAFLQRLSGYSITGETSEQKWAMCTGEGANGKGVFYQTLETVIGTYAHTVPASLLVVKGSENRHPTEVADLCGPRLVLASETEDGAHLREAMLKNITGQDKLSGRYMYQDHFTFVPKFKLHLQTNKKPVIKGQENATWRRILLIEFKVVFGTPEDIAAGKAHKIRDNDLRDKMLCESSGILNWLIEGAMSWYTNGLQPPKSVINSGKQYRSEQDRIGEFVRACCVLDPNSWSSYTGPFDGIYPAYVHWAKASDSRPLGKGQFIVELARVVPHFRKHEQKITVDKVRRSFDGAYGLRLDIDGGGGEAVSSNEDLL